MWLERGERRRSEVAIQGLLTHGLSDRQLSFPAHWGRSPLPRQQLSISLLGYINICLQNK
jgi:hypothetical protein